MKAEKMFNKLGYVKVKSVESNFTYEKIKTNEETVNVKKLIFVYENGYWAIEFVGTTINGVYKSEIQPPNITTQELKAISKQLKEIKRERNII